MNPKIVLFTTDTIQRGGKERQLFIIARYLIDSGCIVRIISLNISSFNYLNEYGIPSNSVHLIGPGYKYINFLKYKNFVSDLNPDVVFSWDLQTSIFNLLLFRNLKFKFINASIQHGIRLFKFSHLTRSLVYFLSPFVMANSYAGLRANNLKPGKRRFVLYNGIEPKFLNKYRNQEIEDLRAKFIPGYINDPGFIFISVANFVPYKDYTTVLKALARLKRDFLFYYLILGDGPMRGEIEKSIKTYELEKRVIIAGRTENVRDYLFASDLMIHSSRGEGISNAILEGMYAGLPVIATNVGGIPETVYSGSSILFPYKDYEALYQCLLRSGELKASFDPDSVDYQTHLRKFSVESMVDRFEEIINTVIRIR